MKKIFSVFLLFLLALTSANARFLDWFSHCNFSMGVNYAPDLHITANNFDETHTVRDGFGDLYSFSYDSDDVDKYYLPYSIDMRLPVYYSQINSAGFEIFMSGISLSTANFCFDLYFNQDISDRFQLTFFGGVATNLVSMDAGELKAAWKGDPGYCTSNGKFIKPGTTIHVSGGGNAAFNAGGSIRFRPIKRGLLYIELAYRYIGASTIDELEVKFGDTKVYKADDIDIHFSATNNISLSVGIGS